MRVSCHVVGDPGEDVDLLLCDDAYNRESVSLFQHEEEEKEEEKEGKQEMDVHFIVWFNCSPGQLSGLDHCDIGYRWATTGMPAALGRTDMNDVKTARSNGNG